MTDSDDKPIPLREVLIAEYKHQDELNQFGALPDSAKSSLEGFYNHLHKGGKDGKPIKRAALCFSGGGIRSATFALGLLQGLAGRGIELGEFHFLSTVSGGGYIGSWLSAWINRKGITQVQKELKRSCANQQKAGYDSHVNPLEPEPEPIRHLRQYSNYMSPKLGLLSADTWTLVATFFRNLLLNWTVLIPLILLILLIPRFGMSVAHWDNASPKVFWPVFILGTLSGLMSITYIIICRPSSGGAPKFLGKWKAPLGNGWFVGLALLPMLVTAVASAVYWAWLHIGQPMESPCPLCSPSVWNKWPILFLCFGVALHLGGFLLSRFFWNKSDKQKDQQSKGDHKYRNLWLDILYTTITGAIGGVCLWFIATKMFVFPPVAISQHEFFAGMSRWVEPTSSLAGIELDRLTINAAIYVCFAAPAFLLVLLLAATIYTGLVSGLMSDADREWLSRAGGWFLITIVVWSLLTSLVIFGPWVLLIYGVKVKSAFFSVGTLTGLLTLVGGWSGKTSANKQAEAKKQSSTDNLIQALLPFAAPLFLVFILILLSLGTSWALKFALSDSLPFAGNWHLNVLYAAPTRLVVGLALVFAAIVGFAGWAINVNKFSLHGAYRDRLIRAYLGASRLEGERNPNPFTGFDKADNLRMWELKTAKDAGKPFPFHIINVALNLVGGKNLAWQERKAAPMTFSPLHAGYARTDGKPSYRESKEYAKDRNDDPLSLGTALAISGAAVSPNMGYNSSPVVTFLLTLFNVRLGWWLGNPGETGQTTYSKSSPVFSPKPLLAETFGFTDDEHKYVYLSDGAHFENLALYEMVRRRCHYILVSDAGADPDFNFDDLGNAMRKIRIDLGIPIEFIGGMAIQHRVAADKLFSSNGEQAGKYCALARIRYSAIDGRGLSQQEKDQMDGWLLYLKPTVYGSEPQDVLNYAKAHPDFPHETTGDQMYSESQFESYRTLGETVIDSICGKDKDEVGNLEELFKRVKETFGLGVKPAPKNDGKDNSKKTGD